jgi:hypothetical protein
MSYLITCALHKFHMSITLAFILKYINNRSLYVHARQMVVNRNSTLAILAIA